jgi:hypothetical protein
MPPKKRDLAAEKAAKQKKMLFVLIPVALGAFWFFLIPTLTKGTGGGGPAVASAAPGTDTTVGAVATPGAVASPASFTPAAGALAAPSYSFTANEGQLQRLSGKLKSKDPFAGAQIVTTETVKAPVVTPTPPSVPTGGPAPAGSGSGSGSGTTPGSTTAAPAPYIYAVVTVNNLAEGVSLLGAFPAASPMFHLDAITASSIKFSLLAGTFANGATQVTLLKGHKLTLRNTADGSRFVIQLITTAKATPAAPTTTTDTSTSVLLTPPTGAAATTPTPPPPTAPTDTTTQTNAG